MTRTTAFSRPVSHRKAGATPCFAGCCLPQLHQPLGYHDSEAKLDRLKVGQTYLLLFDTRMLLCGKKLKLMRTIRVHLVKGQPKLRNTQESDCRMIAKASTVCVFAQFLWLSWKHHSFRKTVWHHFQQGMHHKQASVADEERNVFTLALRWYFVHIVECCFAFFRPFPLMAIALSYNHHLSAIYRRPHYF